VNPTDTLLCLIRDDVGRVLEEPKGSNWGAAVKAILGTVGIITPAPWCAAYVCDRLKKAGIEGPMSGWSPSIAEWYRSRGRLQIGGVPRPGWTFHIYFSSLHRIAHVGFVESYSERRALVTTIEANTNLDGSRDGYGVFRRVRPANGIRSYGKTII
jgi:hypothetical protein